VLVQKAYLQPREPFAQTPKQISVLAVGSEHTTKFLDHADDITSDGFTMTLFPAARAGAIFLIAMSSGWLNGYIGVIVPGANLDLSRDRPTVICATTPSGTR
jgi:hypothetical protein